MEIFLKASYSGYDLIVKADNVNISEDIEEREYHKDDNGKMDYSKAPNRDISAKAIDDISLLLNDMIYYRKKDYDSSELIKVLFDKLPNDKAVSLIKKLNSDYL
jgi:hypothetical protein